MTKLEKRDEEYQFTPRQKALDIQYTQVVDILTKAGYLAVYRRYWTHDPSENPGCIQLEILDEHRRVQEQSTEGST